MLDVREVLQDAAREPTIDVDPDRLWQRGRRRRSLVVAGSVAASLMLVAGAVIGLVRLTGPEPAPQIVDRPDDDLRVVTPQGWQRHTIGGGSFAVPGDFAVERLETDAVTCLNPRDRNTVFLAPAGYRQALCDEARAEHLAVIATPVGVHTDAEMDWEPVEIKGFSGHRSSFGPFSVDYRFPDLDMVLRFEGRQYAPGMDEQILETIAPAPGSPNPRAARDGAERACPPADNPLYDPADFLVLNGRTYISTQVNSDIDAALLGDQIGQVVCRYSDVDHETYGPPRHGDAATLAPGTPLHALQGVETSFRVAARTGEDIKVYEVYDAPNSAVGVDVYDIDQVHSVEVLDWNRQDTLATITDPDTVAQLVDDVLTADIVHDPRPTGVGVAPRYRVRLHLDVGQPLELGLYPNDNIALPLLRVPASFTDTIVDAIDSTNTAQ